MILNSDTFPTRYRYFWQTFFLKIFFQVKFYFFLYNFFLNFYPTLILIQLNSTIYFLFEIRAKKKLLFSGVLLTIKHFFLCNKNQSLKKVRFDSIYKHAQQQYNIVYKCLAHIFFHLQIEFFCLEVGNSFLFLKLEIHFLSE